MLRTLGDELGIDPGQALRDLESAILRQDPALDVSPAAAVRRPGPESPAAVGALRLGGPSVVGRRDEMAALHGLVLDAARGAGGAVFLIGEAGLGKTRLAGEVARLASGAGLRVLRGRAASPPVQFRPLSEALLSVLRKSGPPEAPELVAYRPALSRLVPEWRRERSPDADESLVVLAEAVLRLIVRVGGQAGALLVLEDLHEADADTLAVIDYLLDNAGQEPLLVLGTLRPDPGDALKLARTAQHRRAASVLELDRLAGDAVREMAAGCLDVPAEQVPEPVYERLLNTSDGIPCTSRNCWPGWSAIGRWCVPGRDGRSPGGCPRGCRSRWRRRWWGGRIGSVRVPGHFCRSPPCWGGTSRPRPPAPPPNWTTGSCCPACGKRWRRTCWSRTVTSAGSRSGTP
ncbi:hypothetical protein Asp14428_44870 [Actinoplanes sp. NBRC 14428]|nr:hypothetical protein Asp14428_44870 [Actinoplanes sp. NBRC 14428]